MDKRDDRWEVALTSLLNALTDLVKLGTALVNDEIKKKAVRESRFNQ